MKTRQRATAVEAYHSGHGRMESRVYDYVLGCGARGATILEIATALGVASNCVTGRLTDMLDAENNGVHARVKVASWKRPCRINGRRKIVWLAISPQPVQLVLIGGVQ